MGDKVQLIAINRFHIIITDDTQIIAITFQCSIGRVAIRIFIAHISGQVAQVRPHYIKRIYPDIGNNSRETVAHIQVAVYE
ncbi:hypothetical protein D3C72_705990 [compost metagenome]